MGVCAEWDAEGASETEVSDLKIAFRIDKEVLGFEVAVENTVGVAVTNARHELCGELLDLDREVSEDAAVR